MNKETENRDYKLSAISDAIYDTWRKNFKDSDSLDWLGGAALFIAKLAAAANINSDSLDSLLNCLRKSFETARNLLEQDNRERNAQNK